VTEDIQGWLSSLPWKSLLELSALILGLVNGLILLRNYLRDRPELVVRPIHSDTYQWFFPLPCGNYQGQPTRKYGFLTYIGIANRGIRDVAIESWRLRIKTDGHGWQELGPVSIPEPQIELGESGSLKIWPVLGQKGVFHQGDTMLKSGDSIAGFAFYIAGFYGDKSWNPLVRNGKAIGEVLVRSVLGQKAKSKVFLREIPLEKAKRMVKGIDQIDLPEKNPASPSPSPAPQSSDQE